eukprot:1572183-Pyramimonas_sp.AAC.1
MLAGACPHKCCFWPCARLISLLMSEWVRGHRQRSSIACSSASVACFASRSIRARLQMAPKGRPRKERTLEEVLEARREKNRKKRERYARKRVLEASASSVGAGSKQWVLDLRRERNNRPVRGVAVQARRESSIKIQCAHAQRCVDASAGIGPSSAVVVASSSYHSRGASSHGMRETVVSSRGHHNSGEVEAIWEEASPDASPDRCSDEFDGVDWAFASPERSASP